MAITMTEDQFQAACVKWFNEEYPAHRQMLFAVPNGGLRDRRTAALLQSTGVRPGVSDLVLVLWRMVHFIEMKVGNNTQSQDQRKFESRVQERGHCYWLIYDDPGSDPLINFKNLICQLIITGK